MPHPFQTHVVMGNVKSHHCEDKKNKNENI
uniref:Uncharacterized protein n=1 Tax=Anguilla anguilla TaxID=7936 RepID=A0A0E9THX3_ANGAN